MMKLIVFSAIVAVALGVYTGDPKLAKILKLESDISPDGVYQYSYDTENGISAQENGAGGVSAQGSNVYESPEGQVVQTSYIADENGYHAEGSHIPTPPPTPAAILKLLEYLASHPEQPQPYANPTLG